MGDVTRAPARWESRRRAKIVAIWIFWLTIGALIALLARDLLANSDPAKPLTPVETLRDTLGPYKFLLGIPFFSQLAERFPGAAIAVTGFLFPGVPLAGLLARRTWFRICRCTALPELVQ